MLMRLASQCATGVIPLAARLRNAGALWVAGRLGQLGLPCEARHAPPCLPACARLDLERLPAPALPSLPAGQGSWGWWILTTSPLVASGCEVGAQFCGSAALLPSGAALLACLPAACCGTAVSPQAYTCPHAPLPPDPVYWCLHVLHSGGVDISGISIRGDWSIPNNDGGSAAARLCGCR